ncbi:P-type conjugative transfer protein TrbL [Phenylobacterium sp. SCN 70-31]|uniref:P-type conjugative transfer protein TrbL n=1 Tax=Phenylobacterium sp. SCN 70-31 TaxID=1660129 RepID=UPI00086B8C94|nr:P-type conjugative transfer protein TrbL [Phenylobacterium sp. SCN 70-31]ODT84944.1 MAG: P-type conjugative transfer protein TrbL [Phenylobacterium sp. SCN 70-31]
MATADAAALDQFIAAFTGQVGAGFGAISGDVQSVLATLVVISIVLSAIMWAIDETQNILAPFIRKILLVGFFAWLVTNWHSLTLVVINGFTKLGLKASNGGSVGDFTQAPTRAVEAGLDVVVKLIKYIGDLAQQNAGFGALQHIDMIIVAAVAAIGIMLAFIVLAIEIAITIIEFYIVTLIAFVVVPFGVLTQTSFLAERSIGYVISVGFKFMALAVIAGIGINIFETFTLSAEPTVTEEAGLLLSAIFLMMLALKVPAIAGAMISGGPQLSAGSGLMGAAGVAAGVAGVALAGRTIGGAVAGGWAAGGQKVAAAQAAAGAIPPGGGSQSGGASPSGGGGGGGGGSLGGAAADFARAPVSSAVASARRFANRSGGDADGSGEGSSAPPPAPSAADTVARTRERRSGVRAAAEGSFAAATSTANDITPGMPATPTRRGDDPERDA